jgi:hypothetical protein
LSSKWSDEYTDAAYPSHPETPHDPLPPFDIVLNTHQLAVVAIKDESSYGRGETGAAL